MKQVLAIAAAFAMLFTLTLTFGSAQANPSAQDAPQQTETATPTGAATETATATATAIATTDPCTVSPPKPDLVAPGRNATLNTNTVTFKWKKVECNKRYRVDVRRGAKNGPKIWSRGTKKNQATATGLVRGYTYFWKVRTCTTLDICTWSNSWSFKLPQAPPAPTKTPTPGATTSATPPSGDPPPQIADYKGPGAYLHDNPNQLWRFDCGLDAKKWIGYLVGTTIYNLPLWYTPNEQIKYERMDFNLATIVETGTLATNGSGYAWLSVNTAAWTPDHHYHLIFTGKSSGTVHCGHFDVRTANSLAEELSLDHSDAAVEKVYRAAGLEPPR